MGNFMDSFKNVVNDAANALTDAAKDVSGSVKEYSDVSKLKRALKNEEYKINSYYAQMGQRLYESNTVAPAGMEEQFNGIKASKAEIERLKVEISQRENH